MKNVVSSHAEVNSVVSPQQSWSVRMADSVMQRASVLAKHWGYECGVILKGIEQVAQHTGRFWPEPAGIRMATIASGRCGRLTVSRRYGPISPGTKR